MQKIIHRIWLGPKEMQPAYKEYGLKWKELNPDWELKEWTTENISDIINIGVWDHLAKYAKAGIYMDPARATAVQRADMLGYELIYKYGGVYVNCDIEPLRPLSELMVIVGERPWAAHEDKWHIVNCAYGGPAGHPFWKTMVDKLPFSYFSRPDDTMEATTGPRFLTDVWREYYHIGERTFPGEIADLATSAFANLPIHYFNYVNFRQVEFGGNAAGFKQLAIDAGSFGLHHWGHKEDQINYVSR